MICMQKLNAPIKRAFALLGLALAFASLAQAQFVGGPLVGCTAAPSTGTGWTSSTSVNATQVLASNITASALVVTLDQGSTLTVGAISFLGNPGDGNYVTLAAYQVVDPTSAPFAQISLPYTLQASTNKQFLIYTYGMTSIELKLTTAITGSATVTPYTTPFCGTNAQIWNKVASVGATGAAFDQAPGSAVPANAVQIGAWDGTNTRVPFVDPCGYATLSKYVVNISANTQMIAGSSGKNVYICKAQFPPQAAAVNINFVESATSGNACATSPSGMMGGTTAATGANVAANGGWVLPRDGSSWMTTGTSGDAVCIFVSAATVGTVWYVQQ